MTLLSELLIISEAKLNEIAEDSSEIVKWPQQLDFKKSFKKKYNFDKFYFDDADLVDEKTSQTIPGVKLNKSTAKEITDTLVKHFKLKSI